MRQKQDSIQKTKASQLVMFALYHSRYAKQVSQCTQNVYWPFSPRTQHNTHARKHEIVDMCLYVCSTVISYLLVLKLWFTQQVHLDFKPPRVFPGSAKHPQLCFDTVDRFHRKALREQGALFLCRLHLKIPLCSSSQRKGT